ncbi:signal transduction histidine kinase [Streptomyces sp. 1114.5]|uniref:sensor histidine kinase n=1 Tax=Streptomyces sp. 1114.5 TaxID=1938830 RepID=UPI000F280751|nr:ATP-binding protein [Streptomyces sp. 1114.5]RKT12017.1 signal transduction histidine kinase [Streptomyces sp. 1114.5]
MRTESPTRPVRPRSVRWRRPLAVVAALLLVAPVVLAHPGDRGPALLLALTAASAASAAVLPWPAGRITLGAVAGAVAGASLLVDLFYPGPYRLLAFWLPFEWCALLGLLFRTARRLPERWTGPLGGLVGLATVVLPLRFALRTPQGGAAGPVTGLLLSLLPALGVAGAALYLRVLEARRERAVARARREQRLDVARGLHDFVAHEITGIVLEAQAGQLPGGEPEETAALLRRLEEAGLRALDSMDEMVGALRDPHGAPDGPAGRPTGTTTRRLGLADLPELVARFGATGGGLRVTADLVPGTTGLLPAETQATAYAVVLEALTNIRRHAPQATEVAVRAAPERDGAVRVTVTDNGGPARKPLLRRRPGSGGTGLAGLAARTAAHGGSLTAGPVEPAGWQVTCTLPGR